MAAVCPGTFRDGLLCALIHSQKRLKMTKFLVNSATCACLLVLFCATSEAQSLIFAFTYQAGASTQPPPATSGTYAGSKTPLNCGYTGASGSAGIGGIPCTVTYVTQYARDGSAVYTAWITQGLNGTVAGVVRDFDGNVVLVGASDDPRLPLSPGSSNQSGNAFVAKLSADGSTILSAMRFGGSPGLTTPYAIAQNLGGELWIAGQTNSASFVTTRPLQQQNNARANCTPDQFTPLPCPTGFVAKLDRSGTQFLFASYLGGSNADGVTAMALDSSGAPYLTGYRTSPDFPFTPGAYSSATGGFFVMKIKPDGSAVEYSTAVGGQTDFYQQDEANRFSYTPMEYPRAIAVDANQNAVVAGTTPYGTEDPVLCASATIFGPALCNQVFVARLSSGGNRLASYRVLAAGGEGVVGGLLLDSEGKAYVAGETTASNFPITGDAYQTCNAGTFGVLNRSSFLSVLDPDGSLRYSTYAGALLNQGSVTLARNNNGTVSALAQFYSDGITQKFDLLPVETTSVPAFHNRCLTSAATQRPTASQNGRLSVSPGEIVTLRGHNLASSSLTFDRYPAAVLYSGPDQINAIVPKELQPGNTASVMVASVSNGVQQAATPFLVDVVSRTPALFTANGSGSGQAVALNQDGSRNSPDNPALRGSIMRLFATGFPVDPSLPDGQIAKMDGPDMRDLMGNDLVIGGADCPACGVLMNSRYIGQGSGFIQGVERIEFQVPLNAAAGPNIRLFLNGYPQGPGAQLAIR